MSDVLFEIGYVGLFFSAFTSSTILPGSSELVVATMSNLDFNLILVLLVATLGNYLGALLNYYAGRLGDRFILIKYFHFDEKKKEPIEKLYKKYGSPFLIFSWVPVVGDLMCFVHGALHLNLGVFTFWVVLGKFIRYFIVIKFASMFV
jgi:membrane protein YqaA with SNARE-associated domain